MGLCATTRDMNDCDASSSYGDSEDSIIHKLVSDRLNVDEPPVVARPGVNYPGTVGISHLVFASNNAMTLTKPLFGSTLYKSQASFFQKPQTFYAAPLTEVTPQLFFGSFEDASNEGKLKDLEITHIISLIGPKHEIEGLKHKHMPMSDYGRTDLKRVIAMLWPFVLESQRVGNKLFVHCQCGQNRSAAVVLSILMKLKNDKLDVMYRMVKKKRPMVQINEIYARQLTEIEIELFGKTSVPKNWMSIASYDLNSGDVQFNEEIDVDSSSEVTAIIMTSNMHESKALKKLDEPAPEAVNLSSLKDFELGEIEVPCSNTRRSIIRLKDEIEIC